MRKRTITLGLALVAVIGLSIASTWNLYYLRASTGGELLWNTDEAYLFMSCGQSGFRLNLLDYPGAAVREWAHAPPLPDSQTNSLTVIRVTPTAVEEHTLKFEYSPPDFFTPLGETIYANCKGTLCKWAGDHFENATPEERQQFNGIERLSSDIDMKFDGWSKRQVGTVSGDIQYSVELHKQVVISVKEGNIYRSSTDTPIVDLQRAGHPPQRLWRVDAEPRRISKAEYERLFSRR